MLRLPRPSETGTLRPLCLLKGNQEGKKKKLPAVDEGQVRNYLRIT